MPGKNADFEPSPNSNQDSAAKVANVSFESHHPVPADLNSPDKTAEKNTCLSDNPAQTAIASISLNNLLDFNEN